MQVEEELVAPACCSGVGLGGEGNKDWDTFTNSGAEDGLPEGEVTAVRMVPRPDFAKKPQGDPALRVRLCVFRLRFQCAHNSRKAESVAAIFCGK